MRRECAVPILVMNEQREAVVDVSHERLEGQALVTPSSSAHKIPPQLSSNIA